METATFRVQKARAALLTGFPFFGALAMRLKLEEDPACPTMSVDGKVLRFGAEYVTSVDFDTLKTLVAHEVLHCAYGHHTRRGSRELGRWNRACDYAINPILRAAGFKLWDGALIRDDFEGMSAEEIYSRLSLEETSSGGPQSTGEQPGEVMDAPTDLEHPESAPDDLRRDREDWQIATIQAEAMARKSAGTDTGGIDPLLVGIKQPRVDWRDTLRDFVRKAASVEQSWSRPNRRTIGQDIYLPSLRGHKMGTVAVIIDTSGSCAHVQAEFCAEMQAIGEETSPDRMVIIYADSRVQDTLDLEPGDEIPTSTRRGGGTDFRPAFEWLEAEDIEPDCAIYLTDLYGAMPDDEPAYPVLWATVDSTEALWGEIVHVDY